MAKKIVIDNETNELNYLFGGYFSACGKINMYKSKRRRQGSKTYQRKRPRQGSKTYRKTYRNTYQIEITIYFENLKDGKLFQENFGGDVRPFGGYFNPKSYPKGYKYRKKWRWRISYSEAGFFLKAIQPYLIGNLIKRKVKLALKYHNYKQKHFYSNLESYSKQKHKYYLQMRRLK